jgi:hypothetical protein
LSITHEQADWWRDAIILVRAVKRHGIPEPGMPEDPDLRSEMDEILGAENCTTAKEEYLAGMLGSMLPLVAMRYEDEELDEIALNILGARP